MSVRKERKGKETKKASETNKKTRKEATKKSTKGSGSTRHPRKVKKHAWNNGDEFVGIDSNKYSKIKQWYFDEDLTKYIKTLPPELQKYMSDFMKEWLGANTENARFHKSKKDRKKVYDANNSRNRDIYSNQWATGRFVDYQKIRSSLEEIFGTVNIEDDLIDYIDSKKAIKN